VGAKHILVVEDEEVIRETLRFNLVREGYQVSQAANGIEALEKARELRPDLIVLDLMLPELGGLEVCRILRQETTTPVLVLSARDSELDKIVGLRVGADDYMTKPFSYVVLAARLRALLRRGARPRPAVLTAGDLGLDPAARTVRRGETNIDLTAREFALLEYLMRRAGQVVPKAELLEHVWDAESVADLNVVDTRSDDQGPKRGDSINVVRYGVASQTTTQK